MRKVENPGINKFEAQAWFQGDWCSPSFCLRRSMDDREISEPPFVTPRFFTERATSNRLQGLR